jgi:hypothetical protein
MRGDHGGHWGLFTAPDGDHFVQMTAAGGDFTSPVKDGKTEQRKNKSLAL